jgi:hypothetical protein
MASPALQNVTVNGVPAAQYLYLEKSKEVQAFLASEIALLRRGTRRPITSANGNRNTTVARQDGDRVRYE